MIVALVYGGRDFGAERDQFGLTDKAKQDQWNLEAVLNDLNPDLIIHGGARGADTLGGDWGQRHKKMIDRYPAQWDKYGKGAGFRRNTRMARDLIDWQAQGHTIWAVHCPGGRGTEHMHNLLIEAGLKEIIRYV